MIPEQMAKGASGADNGKSYGPLQAMKVTPPVIQRYPRGT